MLAVFEREFKSLLRSVKAIACIVIYVVVSAILFIAYSIYMGNPYMDKLFSAMSLIAPILIVPVAATVITREKKQNGFLSVLPVTAKDVIVGKFLALSCFFLLPMIVLAIYPIVLISVGGGGFVQAYIMLIMFALFQAFVIALCVMISAFCKKSWKAILFSYVAVLALFVLGAIAPAFVGGVEDALRFGSPFRRFEPVTYDIFDISSFIFYITFAALFLFFAALGYKKEGGSGGFKQRAVISSVLAAVILLANVGAVLLPSAFKQIDISSNKTYGISKDTKDYLASLDDEITMYLIDPYGSENKLHTFIKRYAQSSDKISFKELDSQKDAELLTKYKLSAEEIPAYTMVVESKKTGRYTPLTANDYFLYVHSEVGAMSPQSYSSLVEYYKGLYEYYGKLYSAGQASADDLSKVEEYYYSLVTQTGFYLNADEAISKAIEYVTAPYIPNYYFLTGHGENGMDSRSITVDKLGSMSAEEAKLTQIVINAPTSDYGASDIAVLQKFSDNGGRLLVMTGENIKDMPNLQRLLLCFGLSAEDGILTVKESSEVTATVNTQASVLANASFSGLTLSKVNSIVSQEADGLQYVPLATVGVDVSGEDGEDKTVEKTVAIAVSENDVPKVIWLTGAESFNKTAEGMTEAQKKEFEKAGELMSRSLSWLWAQFPYQLELKNEREYSPLPMVVKSGAGIGFGTVFIVLVPSAMAAGAWLNVYARKKRSGAVKLGE